MNRRLLYILITGICISLVGIIIVQFFWIRNAFQINEAQFNRTVNDALTAAVNKLETKENMHFISRNFEGDSILSIVQSFTHDTNSRLKSRLDSLLTSGFAPVNKTKPAPRSLQNPAGVLHYSYQFNVMPSSQGAETLSIHMEESFGEVSNLNFEWSQEMDRLDSVFELNIDMMAEPLNQEEAMREILRERMVNEQHMVLDARALQHRQSRQPNPIVVYNQGRSKQQAMNQGIRKLDNKARRIEEVIRQMAIELETKPAPLQQRINKKTLQSALHESFANKGIDLPFEFAVVTPADPKIKIPIQSEGYRTGDQQREHKVALFPNDLFATSDLLVVQFPGQQSELFKSLSVLLIGSFLFTLIIILTSGASIIVIIRQKKISDIKTDFINNMTHEFKTPIATISIAADSINNARVIEMPERIRDFTRIIKEENNRMNARVEQVLQMALLDSRDFKLRLRPFDLHEMILKTVSHYKLQIEQREGTIKLQLDAADFMVNADEDHLRNVLINLLDNANKYSIIKPEITVFSSSRGGKIHFGVADRGMGMTVEAQRKAFDKFFRVTSGNIHNIKGFGLGLSYVKAIILAHHGELTVKSELGKGSRFEIAMEVMKDPSDTSTNID